MLEQFGLDVKQQKIITDILCKYPEVEKAIIYGSRTKVSYRESSDIDLTLKGINLIQTILTKIWLDLDESNSPYLFDLSIYSQLR
ncbi:nucleotidyltransferase domain-containing protein [Haemophilus paraphrohaemolyticus]|uniref:Nucleotidyltransferase domain-containing protein n=1 Tax=Haemophilus paraphrohaemolyticus TaxID=736 RepID=A0A369ZNL6_9PAST|nr:nucleotidyltransferase domain-containing protein [Haemophilus paraphrohaemolyticus]RDF08849.1 nucleotidyltransferase domain-containing protein [Haemophilus paraphrohaemolyticus]